MSAEHLEVVLELIDKLGVPLCILLFLGLIVWRLFPEIREYMKARTDAVKEDHEKKGEFNEILRNNSAVIENNTVVLQLVQANSDVTKVLIEEHDSRSEDRMKRIEKGVLEVKEDVEVTHKDVIVIKDRVERG